MEYKGLDFAYTLMINLMKMFRKLPGNMKVSVKEMSSLFNTFIIYESGPIMSITASTLNEIYQRITPAEQN